ncbi:MAG: sulfatase-like hydrolase/transferase [Planctomycetes bacterium]|nr:sulfatase-like hydrolase/transferase [Planctomycetota bacterium]
MIAKRIIPTACLFFLLQPFLTAQKPNIILIMADDLGFECIGANGGTSYQTPNIDQLSSKGMRFEHCYSQPVCTPSRVKIMTGLSNLRNYDSFGSLNRSQVSFGNIFKDAGYKTAIAGKWQLGSENDSPQHFGFDESCMWQQSQSRADADGNDTRYPNPILEFNGVVQEFNNGEFGPDLLSDFICDFIETNKDEAFFAYYPMVLPHDPFVPTPDSADWDPTSPGCPNKHGDKIYFADMVAYMDKMVGKVVAKVEELGLTENTLIIYTGDNGTNTSIKSEFRDINKYKGGKGNTKDTGVHVPFIARWDGVITENSECFDLIDFSDVLPTFCEIGNISIPSHITTDGISFYPQLKGETGNPKDLVYCWYSKFANPDKAKRFTRNKTYKLYASGNFYNIQDDLYEKSPLALESLTTEQWQTYNMLDEALNNWEAGSIPVTGVSINGSSTLDLTVGAEHDLDFTISPTNAGDQGVTWSSSDPSIAEVDSNGLVTAISAGSAAITVISQDGGYASDCYINVYSPTPVQSPFGGTNRLIPGIIEGEHYDEGGEGVAFHDNITKQGSASYRPDDNMDVSVKKQASNGYNVSYTKKGEWLEYTVDVISGTYDITFYYFCSKTPGELQVKLDDTILTTIGGLVNQGNWKTQAKVTIPNIPITGGNSKVLRLEVVNGAGFNIDAIEFVTSHSL